MSNVEHPAHYGGKDDVYEAIKVIVAWQLGFCLGNTVKYIARAGKKDPAKEIEDLEKAAFYLRYRIQELKLARERTLAAAAAHPLLRDELCTCGHTRSNHVVSCNLYGCRCARFFRDDSAPLGAAAP